MSVSGGSGKRHRLVAAAEGKVKAVGAGKAAMVAKAAVAAVGAAGAVNSSAVSSSLFQLGLH